MWASGRRAASSLVEDGDVRLQEAGNELLLLGFVGRHRKDGNAHLFLLEVPCYRSLGESRCFSKEAWSASPVST
jgi:hypothetical protein